MGDPRKFRKTYKTPRKPWDKPRMEKETQLKREYYFKTKTELWKLKSKIGWYRKHARKLVSTRDTENGAKKSGEFLKRLEKDGLLKSGAELEDVLGLKIEDVLERRLQTIVVRRGLSNTMKQARQFINHGKIFVGDKKITSPNYIVTTKEEEVVRYKPGFKVVIDAKKRREKRGREETKGEESSKERGKESKPSEEKGRKDSKE